MKRFSEILNGRSKLVFKEQTPLLQDRELNDFFFFFFGFTESHSFNFLIKFRIRDKIASTRPRRQGENTERRTIAGVNTTTPPNGLAHVDGRET